MAAKTLVSSGDLSVAARYNGGTLPVDGDTLNTSGFNGTPVARFGIVAPGKIATLNNTGAAATITLSGLNDCLPITTLTNNNLLAIVSNGSGDKNNPHLIELYGVWTAGASGIITLNGTAAQFDLVNKLADIVLRGMAAAASLSLTSNATAHGTGSVLANIMITGPGAGSMILGIGNVFNLNKDLPPIGPILFYVAGGANGSDRILYNCNVLLVGDITIDNNCTAGVAGAGSVIGGTNAIFTCNFYGTKGIVIRNNLSNKHAINTVHFYDTTYCKYESWYGTTTAIPGALNYFHDSTYLQATNLNNTVGIAGVFLDKSCALVQFPSIASALNFFHIDTQISSTGAHVLSRGGNAVAQTTIIFHDVQFIKFTDLDIDLNNNAGAANNNMTITDGALCDIWFQAHRTKNVRVKNYGTVTHLGSTSCKAQPEPLVFKDGVDVAGKTAVKIICPLSANAVNLANACTTSGYTASTGTLATGGYVMLNLDACGEPDADGNRFLDLPYYDATALADLAIALTGTLVPVITGYVSFDKGVTWSDELTEAQLKSGQYIIGGVGYSLSAYQFVLLRIKLSNNSGIDKTVGVVTITGIDCDFAITSAETEMSMLRENRAHLKAIEGAGFTTAADSLVAVIAAIAAGGITAQGVRDAMKLAPTAGAPAADSVDEHLDKIGAPADMGSGATIANNLVDIEAEVSVIPTATEIWDHIISGMYTARQVMVSLYTDVAGTMYDWLDTIQGTYALEASVQSLLAKTVYVGNNGTDAAGYGKANAPYKTFDYAYNNSSVGAKIHVLLGTADVEVGTPDTDYTYDRRIIEGPGKLYFNHATGGNLSFTRCRFKDISIYSQEGLSNLNIGYFCSGKDSNFYGWNYIDISRLTGTKWIDNVFTAFAAVDTAIYIWRSANDLRLKGNKFIAADVAGGTTIDGYTTQIKRGVIKENEFVGNLNFIGTALDSGIFRKNTISGNLIYQGGAVGDVSIYVENIIKGTVTNGPTGGVNNEQWAKDSTVAKEAQATTNRTTITTAITAAVTTISAAITAIDLSSIITALDKLEKRLRTELEHIRNKITEIINKLNQKSK